MKQHHRCLSHTEIQIEIGASLKKQGAKPSCLPNKQKPQRRNMTGDMAAKTQDPPWCRTPREAAKSRRKVHQLLAASDDDKEVHDDTSESSRKLPPVKVL